MTATAKKSAVFLALAFAISWAVAIGAHAAGLTEGAVVTLTLMMAGPALSALVCAFAFEKGRRIEALGLHFKPNWWWLLAWLFPILIAAASVGFTLLLTEREYVDLGRTIVAAIEAQAPEQAAQLRAIPHLGLIQIGAAVTIGALINAVILTFTEELGWRGYLHDLWRPASFWRASLATGFVWGLWHAPAILLYGLNYPENRELGVALFTVYCMLLAPILTLVRDRGGSVWAAGVMHGAFNAVGGLTLGVLSDPSFPWNGVVGLGGFLALGLGVAAIWWLRWRDAGRTA